MHSSSLANLLEDTLHGLSVIFWDTQCKTLVMLP